jgi:hypothetical protein
MKNFSVTLSVDRSPKEVYDAVCNVRDWWSGIYSEEITGNTKEPGGEFVFRAAAGAHYSKQRIVEAIPGIKIVWLITDSALGFLTDKDEWTGTRIIFDMSKKGSLTFTHEGLVPEIECYGACSAGWGRYIQEKLVPLINGAAIGGAGVGSPAIGSPA